jgi:hypothetical protein
VEKARTRLQKVGFCVTNAGITGFVGGIAVAIMVAAAFQLDPGSSWWEVRLVTVALTVMVLGISSVMTGLGISMLSEAYAPYTDTADKALSVWSGVVMTSLGLGVLEAANNIFAFPESPVQGLNWLVFLLVVLVTATTMIALSAVVVDRIRR